jgi:hypothetical protein
MNDDPYIREPDNQYNDTLLPVAYNYTQPTKITIKKSKKGIKKNKKGKYPEDVEFPMYDFMNNNNNNINANNFTEEEIMRLSLQEYENEQNKRLEELLEHEKRIQEIAFQEEQNKIIEELLENERKIKEMNIENETNKIIEKVFETDSKINEPIKPCIFENIKIQLEKLTKIDKNENYYLTILNYISTFESTNHITELEEDEHEKFLKIIKQIRIPDNEKIEIKKVIILRL